MNPKYCSIELQKKSSCHKQHDVDNKTGLQTYTPNTEIQGETNNLKLLSLDLEPKTFKGHSKISDIEIERSKT